MGSEMCIRDRYNTPEHVFRNLQTDFMIVGRGIYKAEDAEKAALSYKIAGWNAYLESCLLYTSDAADDMQCVDLGCRRIIKKKKKKNEFFFFKQKTAYFFFSSRRRHTR